MQLSLIHLALLIELNYNEIKKLKKIIDDPSSSDQEESDSAESSMQYIALESALADAYKALWSKDSLRPSYDELIEEISTR